METCQVISIFESYIILVVTFIRNTLHVYLLIRYVFHYIGNIKGRQFSSSV